MVEVLEVYILRTVKYVLVTCFLDDLVIPGVNWLIYASISSNGLDGGTRLTFDVPNAAIILFAHIIFLASCFLMTAHLITT
jgi:hypothetical protein